MTRVSGNGESVPSVIDVDQHLYEPRGMWREHMDPADRDVALDLVDDELGWTWLTLGDRRLHLAEQHRPGNIVALGEMRQRVERGQPPEVHYDEWLPANYVDPDVRLGFLDEHGLDATVLFPNHGLLWERQVDDLRTLQANMRAHNRWIGAVTRGGRGRLHGVGHLDLRDLGWLRAELARLSDDGVRAAMIAPGPVDGRSLAHADLDPVWAAFVEFGVAPVFHVGAHARPFVDAWYDQEPDPVNAVTDAVLLWAGPAVALTNMAVFGVFERHPELRVGVVELTSNWVPTWLLTLDGGRAFIASLMGGPFVDLPLQPSDYIRRQVRVAALAYELPGRLVEQAGEDLFMFGSDWPHAEGIAEPVAGYAYGTEELTGRARDQLYGGNAAWLLGLGG